MIHLPALVVGAVVWYYDKELREFVQKHAGPHIKRVEGRAAKIYQSARRRMVNTKTNDSQE